MHGGQPSRENAGRLPPSAHDGDAKPRRIGEVGSERLVTLGSSEQDGEDSLASGEHGDRVNQAILKLLPCGGASPVDHPLPFPGLEFRAADPRGSL